MYNVTDKQSGDSFMRVKRSKHFSGHVMPMFAAFYLFCPVLQVELDVLWNQCSQLRVQ